MRESETDDVPCTVLDESPKAYQVRDAEDREAWFPKSQVHFKSRNVKTGKAVLCVPLWLLREKGWNS